MATYDPPIADLSIFNSAVFSALDANEPLLVGDGDDRYLRYPIAQAGETFTGANVAGAVSTATATLGTTQLTGATTISSDIQMSQVSGTQFVNCSAPSGLEFKTTTNQAPIRIGQTSFTTWPNSVEVIADPDPKVNFNLIGMPWFNSGNNVAFETAQVGPTTISNIAVGGEVIIDSTGSSGSGQIRLQPKDVAKTTTTGLTFTSTAMESATAGGSSGQHLCIVINGTLYKIALLNA